MTKLTKTEWEVLSEALKDAINDDRGLQDGMLSCYLAQIPQTDEYAKRKNETTPFDYRDLIGRKHYTT